MENEKKPSRLGVRLSAVMVAVLLVVCMAVPAFAYGVYPDNAPEPPVDGDYFIIQFSGSDGGVVTRLYPIDGYSMLYRTTTGTGSYRYYFESSYSEIEVYYYNLSTSWTQQIKTDSITLTEPINIIYCTMDVVSGSTTINFVVPPPPDPLESVGNGLVVVMDWVGSVVSAVVSGPMSGLLILLAVPVAITLLLVAFIVIRRIIWGA